MRNNDRGFRLVELLAVIVILGVLMAIAIPSVTKYITQSRVKTLTTTMDSYVTAVVTQVNNGEYKFSDSTKVFAIPIECISLEKGGTNPFGNWYQANSAYWAYVLIHYDSANYNYQYGFTFKDDAGYGLYPTLNSMIENHMVKTGYDDLIQPKNGLAKDFVSIDKWEGFANVTETTELVVLEAESEGVEGNGQTTCTLCQKGDNYDAVEEEKRLSKIPKLKDLILENNVVINAIPNLTTSINNTSDKAGLYKTTLTNSGEPSFYFRGNVTNNYVSFAGLTWRIIRINETGTIRLILSEHINRQAYYFDTSKNQTYDMYYSESYYAKPKVDEWYNNTIVAAGLDKYVATEMFCEQAKVIPSAGYPGTSYKTYATNFKCQKDAFGKGPLDLKVGLVSIDESIHAGSYPYKRFGTYYLRYTSAFWTMSPAGYTSSNSIAWVWRVDSDGQNYHYYSYGAGYCLRPVINLNADIGARGTGTIDDPYVIQIN